MPKTDHVRICRNLEKWWRLCEPHHRSEGAVWYEEARLFVTRLAMDSGLQKTVVAGCVAALSPSVRWDVNKRQAEQMCWARADGAEAANIEVSTYKFQKEKALEILEMSFSQPETVMNVLGHCAFKTKDFFECLLGRERAVVDSHMAQAAGYSPADMGHGVWPALYRAIAETLLGMAEKEDLPVTTLQASVWLCVKEKSSSSPF